jgi:hypothetical protein
MICFTGFFPYKFLFLSKCPLKRSKTLFHAVKMKCFIFFNLGSRPHLQEIDVQYPQSLSLMRCKKSDRHYQVDNKTFKFVIKSKRELSGFLI